MSSKIDAAPFYKKIEHLRRMKTAPSYGCRFRGHRIAQKIGA
jgi:hypothetical protein